MKTPAEWHTQFLACAAFMALISACLGQPATNAPSTSASADTPAKESLEGFHIQEGFRIEAAAIEPMVSNPVAMAFDENNRLYVAEIPSTPGPPSEANKGRVRLLDELDDKGNFRKSAIFSQEVLWPSALACYAGGVFVASSHEILYLKDTDADGVADVRKVVLSGLGGTNVLSRESLVSKLCWGLDNRIHVATHGLGGAVHAEGMTELLEIEHADFSFDPRTLAVISENGGFTSGLAFDSAGRQFVSEPQHPLRSMVVERRYWLRNPFYVRPSPFNDVLSPGASLSVQPGVSRQPSVTPRAGSTNTHALRFRNPQGCEVYKGHLFPTNYFENVFICDPEAHLVHRVIPQENGLEILEATSGSGKANGPFLVSSDTTFRPMQALTGPDGFLYIADARDAERGRIYRVLPEKAPRPEPAKLGNSRTYDLVATLAHANGWHRDTASRLLIEKRDAAAIPLLSNVLNYSQMPLARIHAVRVLSGSGHLKEVHVVRGLQDKDSRIRVQTLLAAEVLMSGGTVAEPVWNQMKALTGDPSVRVRHQLACTLGGLRRPDRGLYLAQVLSRDPANPWIQGAVLSSLPDTAGNLFLILAGDRRLRSDPAGLRFLERLACMIGVKGRLDEVGQVIGFINREKLDLSQAFRLLESLGRGLRQTRSSLGLVDQQVSLQGWYSSALLTAVDVTAADILRADAIKFLGVSPYTYADISDWLLLVANPQPSLPLRAAAVSTLCSFDDQRLFPAMLERWSGFPIPLRREAFNGLLSRSSRVPSLAGAVEQGTIPAGDLLSPQLNVLRTWRDENISQRVSKVVGGVTSSRPSALSQFAPALRLTGNTGRGRELFSLRCAECHWIKEGPTPKLGPDLAGVSLKGRAKLLSSIVEPSAEIEPSHTTFILETFEGQTLAGVKIDETPTSLTLVKSSGQAEVWSRASVRVLYDRPWSLMPDGLEQGLSHQQMADLLDFLMNPLP